ncbi:ribulose-5-phosphate 4-epimerase/fuculose-1-phosphate aldolase [Brevundimonas vesicularis]|uniref:class II aldolase/adducin family protein n=1 Tax=Brevundimonas vesicularis TaxID=41276 RepID=UPI0018ED24D2|nr:class II aldolase/adducin family protein [Brevundimonas vesicularis]MDQ1193842.1 ribulose-5-phosphate 4-epimerase/fuculose-1-phosphate aldolase [Brevundimonas vesicularis]
MDDIERALRIDLAAAYRLVALYGWDDLIFTHLSVRIPGPDHAFLINPQNLMFEEVTASSLVKIDVGGRSLDPGSAPTHPAGFVIHSAIHMAREDAQAVMHLHTPQGQAVSAMAAGLEPLTQTAMLVRDDIAYHAYEGVATDLEERARLVSDLGDRSTMILRNHGTLAMGRTVAEAFLRLYFLERACEAQVMAGTGGSAGLMLPSQAVIDKAAEQGSKGLDMAANHLAWPALLRRLDRIDPGFRA